MFKFAPILVKNLHKSAPQQQGSALIIALVFLLIMTLLGVATMRGTRQQEIMARNTRDLNLAFQAAEAGLRTCLREVEQPPAPANPNPNPASLIARQPDNVNGNFWVNYFQQNPSFYNTGTTNPPTTPPLALAEVNQQPSCVIENRAGTTDFQSACLLVNRFCYRITARGIGGTNNAVVILESRYIR